MDYVQVIQESLAESADEAWYCEAFKDDPDYDPRNLLIVRDGDVPIAVAAAWQIEWEGRKIGLIHNVGVATDYLGKGLGRIVTILALHRLRERGFQRVLLSSEDHRIPALSLYLSLGFEPVYFSWLHRRRWKKILQNTRSRTAVGKPAEVSGTYASRGTPPD
jgi:mycothiol synthase